LVGEPAVGKTAAPAVTALGVMLIATVTEALEFQNAAKFESSVVEGETVIAVLEEPVTETTEVGPAGFKATVVVILTAPASADCTVSGHGANREGRFSYQIDSSCGGN